MKKLLILSVIYGLAINVYASDSDSVKQLENALISNTQEDKALDLSGYDMRKFGSLNGSNIKGKLNFKNANLKNTNFAGMDIRNIHFQGSNLENANFEGAMLSSTSFINAKLDNAKAD